MMSINHGHNTNDVNVTMVKLTKNINFALVL